MRKARFSRSGMIEKLIDAMEEIQRRYEFDLDNGTAQLVGDPHETERAVAYGSFDALRNLLDDLTP